MGILRLCTRCGAAIPTGASLCVACKENADAKDSRARSARKYNAQRDEERKRFYHSTAWLRTRKAKLNAAPICEAKLDGCQHIACEVHHIKSLRTKEGWEERLDWKNLMSVCTKCHNVLDQKWGKATRCSRDKCDDPAVIDLSKLKG